MTAAFYLRAMWRESRGARGRMTFLVICLAVGVSAVVGVSSLTGAFEGALRAQSRELLGADLVVSSRRPLPAELEAFFSSYRRPLERTDLVELPTMASAVTAGGDRRSRLVRLQAVNGRYPLRGRLDLPEGLPLEAWLTSGGAVVAPELLDELGVREGDLLRLGAAELEIRAVVRDDDSRLQISLATWPRVLIRRDDLAKTGLLTFGSRVEYRAMIRLPDDLGPEGLATLRKRIREEVPGSAYMDIETHDQAQPMVRRALDRTGRFLGLVALLSLLLGGVGVAQTVRTWLAGRTRSIAVLRCLGMRPREIVVLYLFHVATVAIVGSALGCALGGLAPAVCAWLMPGVLGNVRAPAWQVAAALRGLGLGVGVSVLFAIAPLTSVWKVSPARVLRSSAAPLRVSRRILIATWGAIILAVLASAWVQGGRLDLAAGYAAALLLVSSLLILGAHITVRLVSRLSAARPGPYLRHGLAALARPGAGTIGAIVALGLGILVVSSLRIVETRLGAELRGDLPEKAPTVYLWDVQPDQQESVREILESSGSRSIATVPVVVARLREVDGVPIERLLEKEGESPRRRWLLTREQNLTWFEDLPESNTLVEGKLWSDPAVDEISLELGYAEDLGARMGSTLRFDIQGVPVSLRVTSLRRVEWRSFDVNFFLVAEPGVLERAPQFRMIGAHLPPGSELPVQNRLSAAHPNITVIRVRSILGRVQDILSRLSVGVQILGSFTILTGLVILAGAISATTLRRSGESALLRALGLTRANVATLLATEYVLVGSVAGALGALGGFAAAWAFLEWVLEIDPELPVVAFPLVVAASALLVMACGLAASTRALRISPVRVLRET